MRRRTLESVLLHIQHRGSGRLGMKGGRVGPLDRWLSDGSLDTLGLLIWWSLIVCPGQKKKTKFNSIVCPGRFGVLSWCNDILARLGLLHWCNLIVSQGILPRPDLLVFVNTIYVTCVPVKMRQMLLKRTLRIQNCRLLANALVCCSATQ